MNKKGKRIVIILPTYNEKKNIEILLKAIEKQNELLPGVELLTLVVDDCSPDGTSDVVKKYQKTNPKVFLLLGKKQGLGIAYVRGFSYAMHTLHADIIFQMDADLSHNPEDIPRFVHELHRGNDFVIGSRYIAGGSLPSHWSTFRRMNSKGGNLLARYIAGLKQIKDCTSGYRAINVSVLEKIDLNKIGVTGYAVMMNLLYQAYVAKATIKEIPIHFSDRTEGKSKLRLTDVFEFILNAFYIRGHEIKRQVTLFLPQFS
jgi:dolichol-phosphate mannosyltransferase